METELITVQGVKDYIDECRENEIDDLRQVRDKLHRIFHDAALPSDSKDKVINEEEKIVTDFFMWFRKNGELYIDKDIEEMINTYLNHKGK